MSHWKIKKANISGGPDKDLLDGAEIRVADDGKSYELRIVAAKTTGNTLPTGSFQFPEFDFHGDTWTIAVSSVTPAQMTGTWQNDDTPHITGAENGDFTAQAGQGTEDDVKDASAASA